MKADYEYFDYLIISDKTVGTWGIIGSDRVNKVHGAVWFFRAARDITSMVYFWCDLWGYCRGVRMKYISRNRCEFIDCHRMVVSVVETRNILHVIGGKSTSRIARRPGSATSSFINFSPGRTRYRLAWINWGNNNNIGIADFQKWFEKASFRCRAVPVPSHNDNWCRVRSDSSVPAESVPICIFCSKRLYRPSFIFNDPEIFARCC